MKSSKFLETVGKFSNFFLSTFVPVPVLSELKILLEEATTTSFKELVSKVIFISSLYSLPNVRNTFSSTYLS